MQEQDTEREKLFRNSLCGGPLSLKSRDQLAEQSLVLGLRRDIPRFGRIDSVIVEFDGQGLTGGSATIQP